MIFKTIKRRIREKREQKLRMRLFLHFGNSLNGDDLSKMASIYQLMLKLPSRHWKGIVDMMEKSLVKTHFYEPSKTMPEAFEWVRTGSLPTSPASFRRGNPDGGAYKPSRHQALDCGQSAPPRQDSRPRPEQRTGQRQG